MKCQIALAASNGHYFCKKDEGHEGPCPGVPTNLHICAHGESPCPICWADSESLERLLDSVIAELLRRGRCTIPSNHKGPPTKRAVLCTCPCLTTCTCPDCSGEHS